MELVGLGGELVDHCGVAGVLAALLAFPVAVRAAPLAEEVAFQTLAVRAPAAAAFGDQCGSPALAGSGAPVEARLARVRRGPVALDRDLVAAALEGAFRQSGLELGGWNETRRELAAPLGDEGWKVHVVLRFRVATRCASVPERAARARRAVTSRQRGRSEAENPGTRPIGVGVSGLTA